MGDYGFNAVVLKVEWGFLEGVPNVPLEACNSESIEMDLFVAIWFHLYTLIVMGPTQNDKIKMFIIVFHPCPLD